MEAPKRQDAGAGLGNVAKASAQVGAATGIAGAAFGGVAGLFRSQTPGLFAAASGIQSFAIGTTYYATREAILLSSARRRGVFREETSSRQKLVASTVGGGISGITVAAVFRGTSNVLPAALVCSSLGFLGQGVYSILDQRQAQQPATDSPGIFQRLITSRISPMKRLTDQEYEALLKEKLVRVEAEIRLLDDQLANLEAGRASKDKPQG